MIRFLVMLAALAAVGTPGSQSVRAQTPDTTRAAAPVRLIPVKILSPGGVRIRSVRDNRRIVILAPPTRVAPAPAPTAGATREDLDYLEARLQEYFDARTRDLKLAWREAILSLSTRMAEAAASAGPRGPSGATQVAVIPLAAPGTASADSALADTARAALRDSLAALAAADTTAPATSEAPFLGMKPPTITLLAPGASGAEIERAVLEGELLRAVNIIFEFNSAALLPASLSILNSIGTVLAKHPELRLEIDGHTDSSGPAEYNVRLSQARAEAVRDYLVAAFAIGRERLPARGYGESMPVADEATATGRALNRRVEFLVIRLRERPEAPSPQPEKKSP